MRNGIRRIVVLLLFALMGGMGVTAAAPAGASELSTQYSYYDHCNKKGWMANPFVFYTYSYSYSNRAGYYQYYRGESVVPSGPYSEPAVDTWWRVVKCG
jgi:hypothetical protein